MLCEVDLTKPGKMRLLNTNLSLFQGFGLKSSLLHRPVCRSTARFAPKSN